MIILALIAIAAYIGFLLFGITWLYDKLTDLFQRRHGEFMAKTLAVATMIILTILLGVILEAVGVFGRNPYK